MCVPGCFNNNKSFYNFPNGKSEEAQMLRKKWINLVSRKNLSPTIGHRVSSTHFPGRKKGIKSTRPRTDSPMPTRPRTKNTQNHSNITSKSVLFLNEEFQVIWKQEIIKYWLFSIFFSDQLAHANSPSRNSRSLFGIFRLITTQFTSLTFKRRSKISDYAVITLLAAEYPATLYCA